MPPRGPRGPGAGQEAGGGSGGGRRPPGGKQKAGGAPEAGRPSGGRRRPQDGRQASNVEDVHGVSQASGVGMLWCLRQLAGEKKPKFSKIRHLQNSSWDLVGLDLERGRPGPVFPRLLLASTDRNSMLYGRAGTFVAAAFRPGEPVARVREAEGGGGRQDRPGGAPRALAGSANRRSHRRDRSR